MSITELGNLAKWLEVTQSVVAIIGLPILTLTLLMIGRQAQYAHHTAMSQVYQNTADGFAAVQRYFMDNPERVSAIAEFFLHAVHNLTIHRRYMQEYPWDFWERSLRDIYNKSPILQQFLHEHPDWYTAEVHRMLTSRSPTLGARPTA